MRPQILSLLLAAALVLAGCSAQAEAVVQTPVAVATQTAQPSTVSSPTARPSAAPTASRVPPTATRVPSVTPLPPTATPDPVAGINIPELRARRYGEGEITIGAVYNRGPGYTSYRISYPVDGLRLTGLLHVPKGEGPFPVIIANRGYIAPERYQPGMDSRAFSDYFAQRGYLVVAADYRGYGGGDAGPNPFYTGYYADVLNLIPMAQRLPMARSGPVAMWGHSRGASITVAALAVSDQIAAAVMYAPAPADLAEDYARRTRQSGGNPGSDTFPFPPEQNPTAYARVSPINYLDAASGPVMLHHGTADTTVDASASVAIAEALQAAGKDVTLHLYEGGPHTLSGAQERLYFERTLAFIEQHLGTE